VKASFKGFFVLAVAAATLCASPPRLVAQSSDTSKFSELTAADVARLDKQRALVVGALKQHHDASSLSRTKLDLPSLQRLLDEHAFAKTQAYELQSLGVTFGDVLANELGLRWTIVADDYGRDPTLRLGDTTIQVNALTMISKRVERGEAVNLKVLLANTRDVVAKARTDLQRLKERKATAGTRR
jgi:hypothetical protein